MLHKKYLYSKMLAQVQPKATDSPFWKGIMGVKTEFFKHIRFSLGNGDGICFWEDTWLGQNPLSDQYPSLYNIVRHKNVLVANVLDSGQVNIQFRRSLVGDKWTDWLNLVERLMPISLTTEPDSLTWNLTPSGFFFS